MWFFFLQKGADPKIYFSHLLYFYIKLSPSKPIDIQLLKLLFLKII